ncbi:MAG: type I-E CRISPR-associated protein Cas6/Cse3/CasE [Zymomonas mobilis subsp. pomaceae]|uniref:type I-E CRISPR-associated protein Cas6/Cse3/CasE n=1 Tax=Zymomonas mobilis TaxID=542 RepID=UPI0039ED3AF6
MSYFSLAELRSKDISARLNISERLLKLSSGIDPNTSEKELQYADAGHQLIWSLFDDDPTAKRDFIYRAFDEDRFLIVSSRFPKDKAEIWSLESKDYTPHLVAQKRYGFSLRVNPTIALSQPYQARSKPTDVLIHAEKQQGYSLTSQEKEDVVLDWLASRLVSRGAEIERDRCGLMNYGRHQIPRRPQKGESNMAFKSKATFSFVDIEGVLKVTHPESLQQTLLTGIGRGKAFGLGLLLLRPLSD